MKSLKTKVIMSAFVLLFALVATIGSTYAWFTVSSTVTVNSFNLDVTTEESLLIRIYDGENQTTANGWVATDYSQRITNADLAGATGSGYNSYTTWTLTPLTVASHSVLPNTDTDYDIVDLTALSFITDIEAAGGRALTDAVAAGTYVNTANGGYVDISFWLMSQSAGNAIVLQDLTITTSGATSVHQSIQVGTLGDSEATENVFAVNPDYGFTFVEGLAGYLGDANDAVVETTLGAALETLHSLWYNSTAVPDSANIYSGESGSGIAGADVIATLDTANVPELVTVRIWIEGWDAQATNDIISADFDIAFKFSIQ